MDSDDIPSLLQNIRTTGSTNVRLRRLRYRDHVVSSQTTLTDEGLETELRAIEDTITSPSVDQISDGGGEFVLLSTSGDPAHRNFRETPMEISQASLARLIEACRLPPHILGADRFPGFHMSHHTQYRDDDSDIPEALVLLLRNPQHSNSINISMRIRLSDRSTVCFLSALTETTGRTIESQLSKRGRLISIDPLYFLVLAFEVRSRENNEIFQKTLLKVYEVESATEMTAPSWKLQVPHTTLQWLADYDNLLKRLHEAHSEMCHFEHIGTFYIKWALYLLKSVDLLEQLRAEAGLALMAKRHDVALRERIQFTLARSEYIAAKTKEMLARIRGQINVAFSLVTQKDSKLTLAVTEYSNHLAMLAARDSETMKTITVLTLLFLPSSLITSIWSAGLFELESSSSWKIYIAVTISLTVVVFIAWFLYLKYAGSRHRGAKSLSFAAAGFT
ncbi:hypothetical protein M406DRAFT_67662 [Cryphonectria parasitica EP155]|uniref:Uncharacterized protein n=1 Tax=Cryphonectria parasitica (strain ATCC 38755 / EP155) TaxID=660469 RepID=A0A9P4YD76_CRYP1|nr:uncharacterized protein M406DRAFT_67662 [Cryphonectria parasitica EP155]KAF3771352.1 hypothetical protein M406DRAFT_67662 [Cryphonectria parasitica EP155]